MSDEKLYQYNSFGDLKVRRYKREVFYDNLWHTDPILLESRGHVLDANDKLVARPFKKIFNYLENDTNLSLDLEVVAVEKVNGFMFHVTMNYETEEFIQGTTGSLQSPFTELAKTNMQKHNVNYEAIKELTYLYGEPMTFIFEIKDNEKDPHIIHDEEDGVYLLGVRYVGSGDLVAQYKLDEHAELINAKRPKWDIKKFADVLREVSTVYHEGYVLYNTINHDGLMKIKSPYYLSKKATMRKHPSLVFNENYKQLVDEEYYPIIETIQSMYSIASWSLMNEQKRGQVFNAITTERYLTMSEKIKFISNHPKLSYKQKSDTMSVDYNIHSDMYTCYISRYELKDINIGLEETAVYFGYDSNLEKAIGRLYINMYINLGDYTNGDEEHIKQLSSIEYYKSVKKLADQKIFEAEGDIRYYKSLIRDAEKDCK